MEHKKVCNIYSIYESITDSVIFYDNVDDAIDEFMNYARIVAVKDRSILEEIHTGDGTTRDFDKGILTAAIRDFGEIHIQAKSNCFWVEEFNVYRKVR